MVITLEDEDTDQILIDKSKTYTKYGTSLNFKAESGNFKRFWEIHDLLKNFKLTEQEVLSMTREQRIAYIYLFQD